MNVPRKRFTPEQRVTWFEAVFALYDRMRAKATGPYQIEYGGLGLAVHPGVYAPEFFDDTLWFADQLVEIVADKTLLEIGTGTGFIGIRCAMQGAHVTATDINPAAVDNARINAARYRANVRILMGDVYSALARDAKYDVIFWAHPFNSWDMPVIDRLLRTGIDPRYEGLCKYVAGASAHLEDGGRVLLGTGDSADIDLIESIASEYGYELKLISKSGRPLGKDVDLTVTSLFCEFVPR